MTKKDQVFKCNICGNIVQVLHAGGGQLVCCGQPMDLQTEKTEDEGQEKHVPVIEETTKGTRIKVGSVPHPMEEKHYIEWIEIVIHEHNCKHFLKPDGKPETEFSVKNKDTQARAYCNIHGLWKSK